MVVGSRVIVAQNGFKFDYPFFCAECHQNGIDLKRLVAWSFVGPLDVIRTVDNEMHGGCIKLQCLLRCGDCHF